MAGEYHPRGIDSRIPISIVTLLTSIPLFCVIGTLLNPTLALKILPQEVQDRLDPVTTLETNAFFHQKLFLYKHWGGHKRDGTIDYSYSINYSVTGNQGSLSSNSQVHISGDGSKYEFQVRFGQ